jgi:hypothetical protein
MPGTIPPMHRTVEMISTLIFGILYGCQDSTQFRITAAPPVAIYTTWLDKQQIVEVDLVDFFILSGCETQFIRHFVG